MYKEYAIDPSVFTSYDRLRMILNNFGWDVGKVVCDFPDNSWILAVYQHVKKTETIMPKELKKIQVYLEQFQSKLCRRRGNFSVKKLVWLDSAKKEHEKKPFTAIVSHSEDGTIPILNCDDHDKLRVRPSKHVKRTEKDLAISVSLLLQNSKRILFIDPYFDNSYMRTFERMLSDVFSEGYQSPYEKIIEIHTKIDCERNDDLNVAYRTQTAKLEKLPTHIPEGKVVKIYFWRENEREELHNRYIVTNLGGITFGHSVAAEKRFSEKDYVSSDILAHLSDDDRNKLLEDYRKGSGVYELVGELEIVGIKGAQKTVIHARGGR